MTKLMEWLLFITLFVGIWTAVITGNINSSFITEWQQVILFCPLIVLFLCGVYAAVIILYRVFTFNNCEKAAAELQEQIEEAKKDLQSKGVILKNK
ncbi:dolichyl-phosphate mannosyltransferase subunit 3 [Megachile rotundata]|uniref:dolichyl-phosphate mannosyltransferase subunit 3 n=1 Tax=Megachile rotundata TaxID=143995 RepID=UPI000258EE4A|nr:PREDICTED: dolichol-phosphate mannosyltransferase subunit 3 [Megachile rotundata]